MLIFLPIPIKAAALGDSEAQLALGRACEFGEGVAKSVEEAIRWYEKAAAQCDERAKLALADLALELKQ